MKLSRLSLIVLLFRPHDACGIPASGHSAVDHIGVRDPQVSRPPDLVSPVAKGKHGQACEKCPRRKCRKPNTYRDQDSCRCKKCPPTTKPDPTQRMCIPDDSDDKNNEERKKKKEEKFKETLERKSKEFREKRKERKEEKFRQTSERKKEESKKKKDADKKTRKKERMGKCLLLLPLTMLEDAAVEYSNEFFSEEFLADEDDNSLMPFWPPEMDDVPVVSIDTDDYLNAMVQWIADIKDLQAIAEGRVPNPINGDPYRFPVAKPPGTKAKREGANLSSRQDFSLSHHHEKRVIPQIISAIASFLGRLVPVLARIGAGAARLARISAQGGVRAAKGAGKTTKPRQREVANDIIFKRNAIWKKCLQSQKP